MDSKVFVARVADEPYMEISSGGEFGNPITSTFSLRDTGKFKYSIQQYYVIILNSVVGYIQLEAMGQIPGFDMTVSWVNDEAHYSSKINKEVSINATNRKEVVPFFVRFKVYDDLDVITRDQYRNILQLRLVWA
jgi:hypothetical protein